MGRENFRQEFLIGLTGLTKYGKLRARKTQRALLSLAGIATNSNAPCKRVAKSGQET